jgi:hypothetical protein
MALNTEELAQFLQDKPNLLRNALAQTQFKNVKLTPAQLSSWLKQHPNAATRMAKHVQQARPKQAPSFGLGGGQGAGQADTGLTGKAEDLYNSGGVEDIRGEGQRKGVSNALVNQGILSDINVMEQYGKEGPFGGSQTVKKDENGNVIVSTELGDAAKGIAAADDRISGAGRGIAEGILGSKGADFSAGFNPNLTARTSTGDINKDRARIEDEVFSRYTKDLDQNYERDKQKLEAELLSRGVPMTPESTQYQRAMEELNKRYDNQRIDARQRAVEKGGEEFSRSFGIGEALRGNELNEQSGIRSQQIGEVGAFAGMGPGVRQDQFSQYNPFQAQLPDPTAVQAAKQGIKQGDRGLDINQQQVDNAAKTQAEQLALQREQLAMQKEAQNKASENDWMESARTLPTTGPAPAAKTRQFNKTEPQAQSMQAEEQAFNQPLPQPAAPAPMQSTATPQAPAAPTPQPAAGPPWQLGGDRKTLLEQQARIQQRIAAGKEVEPAEAQRRLKLVNQALAKGGR